jgi:pimeloyl-ACP methyl ester carboxylesterase
MDILGFLDQFGLDKPVLIGERLGCVAALLLTAWHSGRIARLVLIDATFAAESHRDSPEARALRDCPPDWSSIRAAVKCPIVEVRWDTATVDNLKQYLQIP